MVLTGDNKQERNMKIKNVLFIGCIILVASCGQSRVDLGGDTAACEVDNDCEDSQVCSADLVCEDIDCQGDDRNCSGGQVCSDDDLCVDADEPADCDGDSRNCPSDECCWSDGTCQPLDCDAGEVIVNHQCVDEDVDVGCGDDDRNCRSDEFCNSNDDCQDLNCDADEHVENHQCVNDTPSGQCTLDSQCGGTQQCTNGQCVAVSCPSGQHAENHGCVNDGVVNPGATRTARLCQNAPSGKTVNGDLTGRSFATDGVTLIQNSFANVSVNAARTQICGDITVQTGGFLEHNVTFIPTGFTGYVAFNQNSQSCQITSGAASALGARSLSPVAIPWHCSGLSSCSSPVPASNEGCDARSSVPAP